MSYGELVRKIRKEKNMSLREFEKITGISHTHISRIEKEFSNKGKDKLKIPIDELKQICDKTGYDFRQFLEEAGYIPESNISPASFSRKTIKIPVLGTIPAGIPIEAIEDITGYEDIPAEWTNGSNEFFGLVVNGDSMEPKYLGGDIVIVEKKTDCESGQNCVVLVNGNEATLKKVVKHSNGITLQPINSKYEPIFYSQKEIESLPVTILGVVKQVRRDE